MRGIAAEWLFSSFLLANTAGAAILEIFTDCRFHLLRLISRLRRCRRLDWFPRQTLPFSSAPRAASRDLWRTMMMAYRIFSYI